MTTHYARREDAVGSITIPFTRDPMLLLTGPGSRQTIDAFHSRKA
jgi:hypothetical protein